MVPNSQCLALAAFLAPGRILRHNRGIVRENLAKLVAFFADVPDLLA